MTTPELKIFRDYIRRRGLRHTPERERIVREIFRVHGHFDVDELYWRLSQQNIKVSKASIYRSLPLLMECGLIREVDFSDGHWHYEHVYGHPHHCHLRCLGCGRVVEFEEPLVAQVEQNLVDKYGFVIKDHTLTVQGYCPRCQKQQSGDDGDD